MKFSNFATRLSLLLLLSFGSVLFAQSTGGNLTGVVYDPAGATVPNAKIVATEQGTNISSTATSTSTGEYRLSNLAAGTYTLTVTVPGFSEAQIRDIQVPLNTTVTSNVNLKVASASTTVEVVASAVTIDTTNAQIQTTFDPKQAANLPSASTGAGVLNLSLLSSGVSTSGTVGVGTGPSVGGQRPRDNNFMLEGVDNNNKSVTGPLVFVPNDDVEEFTLLQNQFSPEYGHSTGGQFNEIVKSGTNSFHGMLYDYNRNRDYNALDNLLALQGYTSNPRYDNNRLGVNFGGPIIHNKLFFFAAFEYNPIGGSATPGLLYGPTAAGYSTLSGLPGISSTNLSELQKYLVAPSATAPANLPTGAYPVVDGVSIESGLVPVVAPNFSNSYAGVLSVDYTLSDKDQLRGRFIYNRQDIVDTAASLPAFYTTLPYRYYLGNLSEFHNFGATTTNEFRLAYNRYYNITGAGSAVFGNLGTFPNVTVDEYQVDLGPDPNAPQSTIINTYQLTDNLTSVHGAHTLKFGFNGERFISPQTFTQRVRGDYEWSTLEGYLTDQVPDVFGERSAGNVVYDGDQWEIGAYANDDWKVRPNFTVNLGVRWEMQTPPRAAQLQTLNSIADVPGLITFQNPTYQKYNFMPRVGFAYSPGTAGTTSIRGGFGIYYDSLFDNLDILSLPPEVQQTNDVENLNLTAPFLAQGGLPASPVSLTAANARALTGGYIPNQVQPKALSWNFQVERVFARNYTVKIGYVGTRGLSLPVQDRINIQAPVTLTNSLPTYLTAPSQAALNSLPLTLTQLENESHYLPAFEQAGFTSNITAYEPIGSSTYHGLDLQVNKRLTNGLSLIGAYTWSHNIDDSTAEVFSTYTTPRRPEDFQDMQLERSDSALDHRNRISLAVVYDVPFFKHSNWFLKNLVGNWEVDPIYTYQTGNWATVQSAIDSNLNGDSAGDRVVVNPQGTPGVGSGATALTNSAGDTVAYLADNPNARYIQAGYGVFPTGGRNTLQMPPIDDVDVTAIKRFNITERVRFEFQAQALNVLNHPQYTGGYLNDVTGIGYTGNDVRQYLNPASVTFNRPDQVFSSNPRQLILVGKFIF